MSQLTNLVPHFYTSILSEYATAIPRGAQWIIFFDNLLTVGETVKRVIRNFEPRNWELSDSIDKILSNSNALEAKGCVFAQGVEIPGEAVTTNTLGLQYNGYLRTTGGVGRDPYQGIRVAFLDTNVSFTELFIRPWVIATSHVGLIDNPTHRYSIGGRPYVYRTKMTVLKLGTTIANTAEPVVLRTYEFEGVCPISVTSEEYNYTTPTGPTIHETTFLFNWYTVKGPDNSILNLTSNKVPRSTPNRNINVTEP